MAEKAVLVIIDGRNKELSSAGTKRYTLQYNPRELSISAGKPTRKSKGDKLYKTGTGRKRKSAEYALEQYSIRVSIPLVFDKSQEYIEKGQEAGDEGQYSVRTEVEGLIAMTKNPNIRCFTFSWGTLCYSGELVSLSGQYTMFTEGGVPIRASVNLSMKCRDLDGGSQWTDMYRAAFEKGLNVSAASHQKSRLQKAILKIVKANYNNKTKELAPVDNSFYKLQVPYNPASLSLSAGLGGMGFSEEEEEESEAGENKSQCGMELSFQLIFDSTEPGDQTDVATIANGLLALMTDKALTQVEFGWGTMAFAGQLSSMQCKFSMFSQEGTPLRATVDISLTGNGEMESDWDDRFEKLVKV